MTELVKKSETKFWRSRSFEVDLDARRLAEAVSVALAEHHEQSIRSGLKADGSGPQPPLDPTRKQGRLARAGDRPSERGHTLNRAFIKGLRPRPKPLKRARKNGALKHTSTIGTRNRIILQWLEGEAGRGHIFYYVTGEAFRIAREAAERYASEEIVKNKQRAGRKRSPKSSG